MPNPPRTYRLLPVLLALTLLLAGAGPLLAHLCAGMGMHLGATEQEHPCCGDHCPDHPPSPSESAAPDATCCTVAPLSPVEALAVDAPAAPRVDAALFAAATLVGAEVVEAPHVRPRPADRGGPPLPVRLHLAFSILLI